MTDDTNDIEQIEKYINGDLTGEELRVFEVEISQNRDLMEKIEAFGQAMKGIEHYDLKLQLKACHEEFIKEEVLSKVNWRYVTSIAASILLVFASTYLFYFQDPQHESLFIEHFEPYEDIANVRGLELNDFKKGMKFYARGEYEKAISTLSAVPKASDYVHEVSFYLGISHLALNQPKEAKKYFSTLTHSHFHEQAKWYHGLSFLRENKLLRASQILSSIDRGEFQYDNARLILTKIQ